MMNLLALSDRPIRRRARTLALILAALLGTAPAAAAQDFIYVAKPGDNPWNLTQRYLKSIDYWPRIQHYNGITEPNAIPTGTRIRIPHAWMRGETVLAQVVDVNGDVACDIGNGLEPVRSGMALGPDALIRTDANGSLTLEFADGSRSQIGGGSELRIRTTTRLKASGAQQVHLDLLRGQVENVVTPSTIGGRRFQIETPAAVAAVRGTDFRIALDADRMRAETLSGEVAVRNQRGEARLQAGTGIATARDERPGRPLPLLPAPALDALPERIERLPVRLPIEAVEGAAAYRSRFAPRDRPGVLASDRQSNTAEVVGNADLPDGRYQLKVRAIGTQGLGGLDAVREIEIDARPEPPFPMSPAHETAAIDERIAFAWAQTPDAHAYHFELAGDAGFQNQILRQDDLSSTSLVVDDELPPGDYFWRVAVSTDEGRGPYSDIQRFRRPPPGPTAEPPEIGDETLRLRWREGNQGDSYQVQLSRGADFAAPEHSFDTNLAELQAPRPEPGTWHVRIRTLEGGVQPGPWSKPQLIEIPHDHWRALWILLPILLAL